MTDSTPPGGLDSPPSTGTPQPLPPPTPALPSRGRQAPSTPAPAPRPARRRTRTEGKGRRRDARPPPAPLAYQHAAPPPVCYQQTAAARLHPVPPGIRHGIQSARHDQHDQQERGEGKGRRAADEEPCQRTRNFFARPYIGRTPPRYTPKDTPAARILHRLQRPFSACLASRADRLQFCFWRVCRTRRPKRPTTDATNARPPAPCPPVDGGALTFSARRHF